MKVTVLFMVIDSQVVVWVFGMVIWLTIIIIPSDSQQYCQAKDQTNLTVDLKRR